MGRSIPFEEFQEHFHSRVLGIRRVLALLDSWDEPVPRQAQTQQKCRSKVYVTRIWCVYEAFIAAQEGCTYSVILPPLEVDRFCECVAAGALKHYLWQSVERLDVETAEASVQADKENILEIVRKGVGFQHLNQASINRP